MIARRIHGCLAVGILAVAATAPTGADETVRSEAADWLYEDCMARSTDGTAERKSQFCRCVGDYTMDLLSDEEIIHVAEYLTSTPEMEEKSERVIDTCNALLPPPS